MNSEPERIGVIGLGLMGTALTERLLAHSYQVSVWNRTASKAEPLVARGAEWCENPLAQCRRVIISLYDSQAVREVLERQEGGLHSGQILIDTTTGDPAQTGQLVDWLRSRGVFYLDAPISGSSEQTRNGEVTVIVGGDTEPFTACADLWKVMGKQVFHVGPCGSASSMKLISNLVLGLNRVALAEGIAFAEALGISPSAALKVLAGSMAYSKVMDVKGQKMLSADYSVQARLSQHAKDVRVILKCAADAGIGLPMTETHLHLLEKAESAGLGGIDNSAIIEVLRIRGAGSCS